MSSVAQPNVSKLRVQFFDYLFGGPGQSGYLCIASCDPSKTNWRQRFFQWPLQKSELALYIENNKDTQNIYFCVSLLTTAERKKEYCLPSSIAWADLDLVDPTTIEGETPKPTMVVESSPNRFQGYWRIIGDPIPAEVAEDYSRRLAYEVNADKSGWDMTQLLRVPWTRNFKYNPPADVRIISVSPVLVEVNSLENITPPVLGSELESASAQVPMPNPDSIPSAENVIYRLKAQNVLDEEFASLYTTEPPLDADWSRILWRFIHKCFEVGCTSEETFALGLLAKCNKYQRDNRPLQYLWRDVRKAAEEHKNFEVLVGGKVELLTMPQLVDFDDFEEDTFIKSYKEWANHATDAPEQYHELTCFIALSSVVCSGLYLSVEWGEIIPNLWGLVLGESTLTRKTTAMRLAVDMLKDIDDELIIATDGSAEGLLTGLSNRPRRVSIFWKDEVSGLFDSINRKDYLAGLPETLTQLYDVPKVLTRLLRKETITITEPYFIFFGGGIRDKVYSLLNDEYILSGFLPRFLVVSGENDLSRVRRTGPPTIVSTERKDNIVRSLCDLRDIYNATMPGFIAGQKVEERVRIEARLTPDAWKFYGDIEEKLTMAGADSDMAMLALPAFTRMAFSILKMSLLVAASRRQPDQANRLIVEDKDVKQAAFYVQKWGPYMVDLLVNAGRSNSERIIQKSHMLIKRHEGITRAEMMQRMHLTARESKELIDTMVQRGLVQMKQAGRGFRLYSL